MWSAMRFLEDGIGSWYDDQRQKLERRPLVRAPVPGGLDHLDHPALRLRAAVYVPLRGAELRVAGELLHVA